MLLLVNHSPHRIRQLYRNVGLTPALKKTDESSLERSAVPDRSIVLSVSSQTFELSVFWWFRRIVFVVEDIDKL